MSEIDDIRQQLKAVKFAVNCIDVIPLQVRLDKLEERLEKIEQFVMPLYPKDNDKRPADLMNFHDIWKAVIDLTRILQEIQGETHGRTQIEKPAIRLTFPPPSGGGPVAFESWSLACQEIVEKAKE